MQHSLEVLRVLFVAFAAWPVLNFASLSSALERDVVTLESPDGKLAVGVNVDAQGVPSYTVRREDHKVLDPSPLGLVRDDADFSQGLRLVGNSAVEAVEDDYEILTAKRRANHYRANRQVFHLQTADGKQLDIEFQVSNDGVAFRYVFPDTSDKLYQIKEELSSFQFPQGAKAWLQPMSVAKTGWEGVNPCYEEHYQQEIAVDTPSTLGAGWCFPALFRSGDDWVLVSECNIGRNYCASRLRNESPGGKYTIGFPDPREGRDDGPVAPESTLPWTTPWRILVVGDLQTVAESTLGIDLAVPAKNSTAARPGKAAWSWALMKDGATVYDVQKRMIDYAADMGWEYCLVDAAWDKQISHEKLAELADYARGKNVKIIVWENAAGNWNTTPYTPRNLLLTREGRQREFERLKSMGVSGMKIDFFGGDGQSMIGYYLDLLEESAPYDFAINFHGSTPPRGWQRTYPHLMTAEAVRGLEFATFEQQDADAIATHVAMLPFTRNVFDPMDFTPMVLDKIPNIERRTTSAFELALSVLLTSGVQHFAEIPEGMAKAPEYVRQFLHRLPSVWDDTQLLDGYPGKHVVLARRHGNLWYVAGINAEAEPKQLVLDLKPLATYGRGTLITDGDDGNLSFQKEEIDVSSTPTLHLTLKPRGGFVLALDASPNDQR